MKSMTQERVVERRSIARRGENLSLFPYVETCNIRPPSRSGRVLSCVSCGETLNATGGKVMSKGDAGAVGIHLLKGVLQRQGAGYGKLQNPFPYLYMATACRTGMNRNPPLICKMHPHLDISGDS
jgi:hypothetical protein